jgi:hypothetical protein
VLFRPYIVLLSLCAVLLAIYCPFVPVWCFVGHILCLCPYVVLCRQQNHIGTKEQSMADKAPHRDKRTIYGRQNSTHGQKDNTWPKKHYTGTKGQSMADKESHRAFCPYVVLYWQQIVPLSLCGALSAIYCPFVPMWFFVDHRLSFCPCVVLCLPYIVLLSLCGSLSAIDCSFESMADKAPHRDKRTIYGRQSTT